MSIIKYEGYIDVPESIFESSCKKRFLVGNYVGTSFRIKGKFHIEHLRNHNNLEVQQHHYKIEIYL